MGAVALLAHPSACAALVRQRTWDWLSALQRRLGVDRLQLIDEHGTFLLPDDVPLPWPDVQPLVDRALQSRNPESVRTGDVSVTCVAFLAGEQRRGGLLLAREVTDSTAAEARTELELIGSWLRPAVEAHLGSVPPEASEQAPRVLALFRVLSDAATTGRESALLRLYANALAIWHDVDFRAYAEDVEGNLRLAITLPGAVAGEASATLDGNEVSIGADLTRVSGHDLEVLGFRPTEEVLAARIGDVKLGTVWLVVLSGQIDLVGEPRLALYTDVLRQVLQNVAAGSLLDAERDVWQTLVGQVDSETAAADTALQHIAQAVGARAAGVLIADVNGTPLLRVGDFSGVTGVDEVRSDRLVLVTRSDNGPTSTLAVQGQAGVAFTSRDREVLGRLGRQFASWAGGHWPSRRPTPDRRSVSRSFEHVIEEAAIQAAAHGTDCAIVVIAVPKSNPREVQQKVSELRPHVRAGEAVGVLGAGEIGLLLYQATPDVARTVVNRLRHAGGVRGPDIFAGAAIGVAHCSSGAASPSGLVEMAREDARRGPRVSRRGGPS
jgi:hypothetical protein